MLPAEFAGLTLPQLAAEVVEKCPNGLPAELSFDFSRLKFIHPTGITFLSNLIHWLVSEGTSVSLSNTHQNTSALRYLDDSLFFEQHCGEKLRSTARLRQTTLPLQYIAQSKSHAWLESRFVPWLATRLNITQASLGTIKTCISELFINIQDHTTYDIGSMFIQHFPKKKRVTISVADFGIGIPEKVRQKLPHLSDSQAITKAVEEGFTTKSQPNNAGIGLNYLLQAVVLNNGGEVTFYSRKGIVTFSRHELEIKQTTHDNVGFCPGTTIDINLRTDTIEVLPDELEELKW
jgi:anti-sigma regulatory factor (Ser/Thr protein kinase)